MFGNKILYLSYRLKLFDFTQKFFKCVIIIKGFGLGYGYRII